MATPTKRLVTPKGDLAWVFITGEGRKDLNGNDRFVASVKYPNGADELAKVQAEIKEFWDENKPKGKGKPKSTGVKVETDKEGEETGFTLVNMWTGTTFPNGNPKVVKTYNSKGAEVSLGSKSIGNGSVGSLSGTMAIYENGPNVGVTIYLNAVQLSKFVEFSQDAGFEADDEEGFTGLEGTDFDESDEDVPHQPSPKVKL